MSASLERETIARKIERSLAGLRDIETTHFDTGVRVFAGQLRSIFADSSSFGDAIERLRRLRIWVVTERVDAGFGLVELIDGAQEMFEIARGAMLQ